ncbi:MAG: hypothetical protein WB760_25785 [Xanthobacteraceae bacterium]
MIIVHLMLALAVAAAVVPQSASAISCAAERGLGTPREILGTPPMCNGSRRSLYARECSTSPTR